MFEPNHTTGEYWQESSVKRNPTVFTNKTTALLHHLWTKGHLFIFSTETSSTRPRRQYEEIRLPLGGSNNGVLLY